MPYSTYSEYIAQGGTLDEQAYSVQSERAAREIDLHTFGRAAKYREEMTKPLSLCECELVGALSSAASVPVGVSSESNDGYSISYSQNARTEQNRNIEAILMRYLLEPVNLLYAGVLPCDYE